MPMNELQRYRQKMRQMARREVKKLTKDLFPLVAPIHDTWSVNLKKSIPLKRANFFFTKECKRDEFGHVLAKSGTYYTDGILGHSSMPMKGKQSLSRKVTGLSRKIRAQYITNRINAPIGHSALNRQDIERAHARKHNRFM